MSSTNRGSDRHVSDYYFTPKKCIKEFFNHWLKDLQNKFHDDFLSVGSHPELKKYLDPTAGGDDKHEMSYPAVIRKEFDPEILDTIDLRQDSNAEIKQDYLWWDKGKNEYDVIITNPPFYIAQDVIAKALSDVKDDGYVVMLLRLNFFGSKARKAFFEQQMPVWAYVHNRRMSFTDDKQTDSIEYMHAVWQKGYCPEFTMLKII